MPGGPELLVLFVLVLILFGPDRLPELARGLGKAVREMRRMSTEVRRQMNLLDDDEERR